MVHLLDEGLNPQAAPTRRASAGTRACFDLEPGFNPAVVDALRRRATRSARDYRRAVRPRPEIIARAGEGESWVGATEPRADGSVIGFDPPIPFIPKNANPT